MGDYGADTIPPFTFSNTISGKARSGSAIHHGVNPVDKSLLWDVPIATEADVEEAVKAARAAFRPWSRKSWEERQKVLSAIKDVVEENKEALTKILMLEGGKPQALAAGEVYAVGLSLKYYSTCPAPATEVLQDDDAVNITLSWVPYGITAAICPWNFPLVLSTGKWASALVTGNTCIVKPSPFTPYSALYLIERVQHLLPAGVLQGLNGDDKLGPILTTHPDIDRISFTGSIATGKRVMAAAAGTLKRISLELGGNSACIVCPDVDIAKVAPMVALGAFMNSGQLCVASKRIYVHESIYDEFKKALVDIVKSWKVGAGDGVTLGPVQNGMQYELVRKMFEDCAVNGYEFACGGEVGELGGYIIPPAIVNNPPETSRIVQEEPFGPIVPMMPWSTEADLLPRVNNTRTGLGGAVYSADVARARAIAREIEAGTVWINSSEQLLTHVYFAGHKESGMGGEHGMHGLLSCMNAQAVHEYKKDVGRGGGEGAMGGKAEGGGEEGGMGGKL